MDYQKFIQASLKLGQAAAEKHRASLSATEQEVAKALESGDRRQAIASIELLLERQPGAMRWWHELATLRLLDGDRDGAMAAWQRAVCCDPIDLARLHQIGQGIEAAGQDSASIALRAWAADPASPSTSHAGDLPALRNACLQALRGDWSGALPAFDAAFRAAPRNRLAAANLAFLLESLGRHGQIQCVYALNLLARGKAREAAETFGSAPEIDAKSPAFLGHYLRALRLAGQEQQALRIAEAMEPDALPRAARLEWADVLRDLNRLEDAREVLRDGAIALADPFLELHADLLLPAVPASQEQMDRAHRQVHRALLQLPSRPLPEDPAELALLEEGLRPNFFLSYLGSPCVEETRAYAQFVERVMKRRFPEFAPPLPARTRPTGRRIRIGCATSFMNHHVVMKCFAGWLQHADRDAFEIHLFPLATEANDVTHYLASLCDVCHAPATETETAARQIGNSGLDILFYPEIGLDKLSFRLAAMQLAAIQCATGGHPITTGFASLDYFISVEAAEPGNAADHYTEQLVTLPGMGVCMPLPLLPEERKTRADFGLAPHDIVYLSTQGLFKYLPRHDELFPRIAESVPDAVFVFVEGTYPAWTRTFHERLCHAFERRGLPFDQHVRFVPRQNYIEFLSLNAASDIFLDPPGGCSGGMTTRDALACGLPIVTLPGTLMRNRQSFGLLTELGIRDTIAADVDDYIRLAIELGRNAGLRTEISNRTRERSHLLFEDTRCVAAFSAFLRHLAGATLSSDTEPFTLWPAPN